MKVQTFVATAMVVVCFLIAGCTEAPPPAATGPKVTMGNMDYTPKEITAKKGETITWENTVALTHTVTFDDASMSAKSSKSLNKGAKHTASFDAPGTYKYHCAIQGHATEENGTWTGMVGSVVITA